MSQDDSMHVVIKVCFLVPPRPYLWAYHHCQSNLATLHFLFTNTEAQSQHLTHPARLSPSLRDLRDSPLPAAEFRGRHTLSILSPGSSHSLQTSTAP